MDFPSTISMLLSMLFLIFNVIRKNFENEKSQWNVKSLAFDFDFMSSGGREFIE